MKKKFIELREFVILCTSLVRRLDVT